jgi:hypothetical protein
LPFPITAMVTRLIWYLLDGDASIHNSYKKG